MKRIRITIKHNRQDPAEDLRIAARLRRDLWAHSPVELVLDSLAHATHRDSEKNAYFEFITEHVGDVQRVIDDYKYSDFATVDIVQSGEGSECVSCGNISPDPMSVCPNCKFRDIDPCPNCNSEIARLAYHEIQGDLFKCPKCSKRVRFSFADPEFENNGTYAQPVVRVALAEEPINNEI